MTLSAPRHVHVEEGEGGGPLGEPSLNNASGTRQRDRAWDSELGFC